MGVYKEFLQRQYPNVNKCVTTGMLPYSLEIDQVVWVKGKNDTKWHLRYYAGKYNEDGIICWFGHYQPEIHKQTSNITLWSIWSVKNPTIQTEQIYEVWYN